MAFLCPECGMQIGEGTREDGYIHLSNCLHFDQRSVDETLRMAQRGGDRGRSPENAQRIEMGMLALQRERESAVGQSATPD